jgi:hypothetical protein
MTKLYRPSNGTEGMMFMAEFCERCERERLWRKDQDKYDGCQIAANSLVFNIGEDGYPAEWIEDDEGPRCTAFEPERKPQKRIRKPKLDGELFSNPKELENA